MIRAILKNGTIQPVEPLPSQWSDGQELFVEEGTTQAGGPEDLPQWEADVAEAAANIAPDDHDRFRSALADIEAESKESVRKEWGLP